MRPARVRIPRWAVLVVLVLALGLGSLSFFSRSSSSGLASSIDPLTYSAPLWQSALGGDQGITPEAIARLSNLSNSDLPLADATKLATLARSLWAAEVTGAGRSSFPSYFPVAASTQTACTGLDIQAISPMRLPLSGVERSKVLVAWTATCPAADVGYVPSSTQVGYVYALRSGSGWVPVHDWEMPRPTQTQDLPAAWQLASFTSCGSPANTQFSDRTIVVDAFEKMCADATQSGVSLQVTAALRSPQAQADLFQRAVAHYGSADEARKWVAYSDGKSCLSKHCTGEAVDVLPSPSTLSWLEATVGCDVRGSITLGATSCAEGTPIQRMQRYGFLSPAANIPSYLEFYLPTTSTQDRLSTCSPTGTVPTQIASVWRCRLQLAGITGPDQQRIVAEALAVSRCESGWNPAASAFGGRYATSPDPVDGKTYPNEGVFMLTPNQATYFVPGGQSALTDPVASSMGAVSLWLATKTWDAFGCATGKGGAFESGPVLPQYGGPALPAWTAGY